jgi:cellulose synthase/poly-beta-1,6-N-acetylglucosamine synthase-like glycosyltransferase
LDEINHRTADYFRQQNDFAADHKVATWRASCPGEELNRLATCDPGAAGANSSMKTSTTLSILVPVYNEEYLVRASLERLKMLGQSPLLDRVQIIVVDDGSTDHTGLG